MARGVLPGALVKRTPILLAFVLAACGGSSQPKPVAPPAPVVDETEELGSGDLDSAPPVVDELPPPPEWEVTATLVPVKGTKLAPAVVTFTQTEGEGTRVVASLEGLKPGLYHLAVHAATTCGKNATKAGAIWDEAAGAVVTVEVAKGAPGVLDTIDVPLQLDGEYAIVGHALVLHADKKGKPGKAVACGEIAE